MRRPIFGGPLDGQIIETEDDELLVPGVGSYTHRYITEHWAWNDGSWLLVFVPDWNPAAPRDRVLAAVAADPTLLQPGGADPT